MKLYYNEITLKVMTEAEFIADCKKYIKSLGDNNGKPLPTVEEVMLNTDYIFEIK